MALWTVLRPEPGAPNLLVGTVAHRTEAPHVAAVDTTGREAWRTPTPGRAFCDCIRAGDLTGDGRPEIGFSVDDAGQFWIMDCEGRVLWTKEVRTAFGEAESHVDDFVIGRISPSGLAEGNQVVVVPGPNLLDCRGNLVWTQRQRLNHAQSVRVAKLFPELPGQQVYSVDTYDLVAYLFSCDGELLWTYDNFTRVKPGVENARMRLTTASAIVDWSGQGRNEIVQTEIVALGRKATLPSEPLTLHIRVLDRHGREVALFPFQDDPAYGFAGAMCAIPARISGGRGEDVVVVTHNSGKILIFSAL